jgi:hypothetical protein
VRWGCVGGCDEGVKSGLRWEAAGVRRRGGEMENRSVLWPLGSTCLRDGPKECFVMDDDTFVLARRWGCGIVEVVNLELIPNMDN